MKATWLRVWAFEDHRETPILGETGSTTGKMSSIFYLTKSALKARLRHCMVFFMVAIAAFGAAPVLAQNDTASAAAVPGLSALARVMPTSSDLGDKGGTVEMVLALSQGVPFRLFTLDAPRRLVIDFHEVDWSGFDADGFDRSQIVTGVRVGVVQPGWSRMVLDLDRPMQVKTAALNMNGVDGAHVILRLTPTTAEAYAADAGAPEGAFVTPAPVASGPVKNRWTGDRPLVVVLDPGHGGIDPGAQRGGVDEADLMLTFAREIKEVLLRAGGFKVVLTRTENVFVPLEARVSIARQAGADVFLSLHADALAEGRAIGTTVYTLSDKASDLASQKLAERHDRGDLLAGVDLRDQDDSIALVLMDIARTETAPMTDSLATALVQGLRDSVGVRKRPHLSAGFSVLKAPDIPSVLLEIGFMSSPRDLKRLKDPQWRLSAARGIRDGLRAWADQIAAEAPLLRK